MGDVEALIGLFPVSKIVFLTRDPEGILSSYARKGRAISLPRISNAMAAIEECHNLTGNRSVLVRYEELSRDPEQALSVAMQLITWLGEKGEPELLRQILSTRLSH